MAEQCQHGMIVPVLAGGVNGDEIVYLCANRECKEEFVPAARLASVEEGLCDALMAARQGEYDGLTVEQHLEGQIADLRAVLGSDAHTEQEGGDRDGS